MATASKDPRDEARWSAVEEATELMQEAHYPEALVALRDVIKADRENAYAFHFLGAALFELGQLEPARDAYRAALRLAPNYLGSRVGLSHVLRLLGDLHGAVAAAKEALRRFPKDGEAMHAAGLANAARGDRPAARKDLQGFLRTNPELESASEVRQALELLGLGEEDEPIEFE
jgi:tetratricopeptide (TPR) repeat protein